MVVLATVMGSVQWHDSLPGHCLGHPYGVSGGLAHVGVVQEPVHGGGGQGLGHQLVEAGRVQVRADRYGAFLVGGVHDAVEALGGIVGDRQQADVVDDDQVGAQDSGDGFGDGCLLYTSPSPRDS